MKKIIVFFSIILSFMTLLSCDNKKIVIDDVYGSYKYVGCKYYNYQYGSSVDEDLNNIGTKFCLKEKNFIIYYGLDEEPVMDLTNIEYRKHSRDELIITNSEIKKLFKDVVVRFDLYKNNNPQGYSFVFTKNSSYFMEYYLKNVDDELYTVKRIVKMRKLNN